MGALNLRDRILSMDDLDTGVVTIKEWDNLDVTVRELSAGERDEVIALHQNEDTMLKAVFRTITLGAIDEDGTRIFNDDDAEKLAEKSDAALTQIYQGIVKLSGLAGNEKEGETPEGKPSATIQDSGETTASCTSSESEPTPS